MDTTDNSWAEVLQQMIERHGWKKDMSQIEAICMMRILEILREHEYLKGVKK